MPSKTSQMTPSESDTAGLTLADLPSKTFTPYYDEFGSDEGEDQSGSDDGDREDDELAERLGFLLQQRDGQSDFLGASNSATVLVSASKQISDIVGDSSFSNFCLRSKNYVEHSERENEKRFASMSQSIRGPPEPVIPEKEICQIYVDKYFAQVHHLMPFLDEADFRTKAISMHDPMVVPELSFSCLYLMVLAMGSHVAERVALGVSSAAGYALYLQANELVRFITSDRSLQTIQAMILVAQYMETINRLHSLWGFFGFITRTAQSLGLHRRLGLSHNPIPDEGSTILFDTESRRRTFWVLYLMDNHLTLVSGKPAAIQDFDCDQELPSVGADELKWSAGLKFATGKPFTFFHAQIQLARLSWQVQHRLYSVHAFTLSRERICDTIKDLDAKLSSWLQNLPDILQPEVVNTPRSQLKVGNGRLASDLPSIYSEMFIPLLHLRYYNLSMTIHRRSRRANSSSSTSNTPQDAAPRTYNSYSVAVQAARSGLEVLTTRTSQIDATCFRLNLVYPMAFLLVLFGNVVRDPGAPSSRLDVLLIKSAAASLQTQLDVRDEHLTMMREMIFEIIRVSDIAIARSQTQHSQDPWDFMQNQYSTTDQFGQMAGPTMDGFPDLRLDLMDLPHMTWTASGLQAPSLYPDFTYSQIGVPTTGTSTAETGAYTEAQVPQMQNSEFDGFWYNPYVDPVPPPPPAHFIPPTTWQMGPSTY